MFDLNAPKIPGVDFLISMFLLTFIPTDYATRKLDKLIATF